MAATPNSTTILERCRVAPPDKGGATPEQILPLTFLDMVWLHFHPIQRLLFYQFPCSKTHFLQKIVPTFKKSLSQTLKHFLPLAGNLIYPLTSETLPQLRYVPGDSVSVTVTESKAHDFDYLTGNHPRVSDEFYAFFPDLPPPETEPDWGFEKIALLTVQITLFPGAGICIGINNNHTAGDASSIVGFIKAWSSIAIFEGDREFLANSDSDSIPIYDRSLITDPSGLVNNFWNQMKHIKIQSPPLNFPLNKVRSTYILRKHEIQKLRNFIQSKKPSLIHLSSFTITSAYVWACLAKSAAESVADNEAEYFAFAVDARRRTNPPVPATYFGNCVGLALAETTHSDLKSEDGFLIAVELIGEVISSYVNNKEILMSDAAEWPSKYGEGLKGKRVFGVAGSPKFDLYDTDFGWGKAKKYEAVGIDGDGSMSLCKSREFDDGLEIGLSLTIKRMDAFAVLFSHGLKN